MKESLSSADDTCSVLDVRPDNNADSGWKRHVVFAGTALLQHSDCTAADSGGELEPGAKPVNPSSSTPKWVTSRPPDKGAVAMVVRTGFGTSQVIVEAVAAPLS